MLVAESFRIVMFSYPVELIYAMEYLFSFCDHLHHKNTQVGWS
jgi:hypothetical protein